MKTIIRIGNPHDSKKVIIKAVTDIAPNKLITTDCVLFGDDEYYHIKKKIGYNTHEVIVRKHFDILVECEKEDAVLLECMSMCSNVVHIAGDKFLMNEICKLWNNTITGLNYISHFKEGTIITPMKPHTFYKHVSLDEYIELTS